MNKQAIIDQLQILAELPEVSIEISGRLQETIRIIHRKHHAAQFLFRWQRDRFIGYFVDANETVSQGIIALCTPLAAIQFTAAYLSLNNISINKIRVSVGE